LTSFQKLDLAAAPKYLPGERTMVKIYLDALIMLLLCQYILHPFPFKGRGAYLEMDSRGIGLCSLCYLYILFLTVSGFKTTVETRMLPTLTWHPCSVSWKQGLNQ